jgi:hypothetical protein
MKSVRTASGKHVLCLAPWKPLQYSRKALKGTEGREGLGTFVSVAAVAVARNKNAHERFVSSCSEPSYSSRTTS